MADDDLVSDQVGDVLLYLRKFIGRRFYQRGVRRRRWRVERREQRKRTRMEVSGLDRGRAGAIVGDGHGRRDVAIKDDVPPIVRDGDAAANGAAARLSAVPRAFKGRGCGGGTYASIEVLPPGPTPTTAQARDRTCSAVGARY